MQAKNCCNVGTLSEFNWLIPKYRTRLQMIRYFDRLLKMDENRLPRKIFKWDKCDSCSLTTKNTSAIVKEFEKSLDSLEYTGVGSVADQILKGVGSQG